VTSRLVLLAAALAAAVATAHAEPAPPLIGANVESLLDYAKARNPEYAVMRLEAEAARERIYPAGALPDPVFRTELRDVTNEGRDASSNLLPTRIGSAKYTFIQPLPFWGKRDLKREIGHGRGRSGARQAPALRGPNRRPASRSPMRNISP
jgi:cobalt-zinc-cadmium efflux system outer membrane protein